MTISRYVFLGIIFSLFIITITNIYALEIGLSPTLLKAEGNAKENICKNITIDSDRSINLAIEDRWTSKKDSSRNLKDYNLKSANLGIEVSYTKKIFINSSESQFYNINICFNSEKPGFYNGALIVVSENGYVSVGNWIELNILSKGGIESIGITGNSIKSITSKTFSNPKELVFVFSSLVSVVLLIVLYFLVKKLSTKKYLE